MRTLIKFAAIAFVFAGVALFWLIDPMPRKRKAAN